MTLMRHMKSMKPLDWVAFALPVIGGINWGMVAIADYDIIEKTLGRQSIPAKIVYGLVGLSALYLAISGLTRLNECTTLLEETKPYLNDQEYYEDIGIEYRSDLLTPVMGNS